jgi:glycosyltransferase 2 family protein
LQAVAQPSPSEALASQESSKYWKWLLVMGTAGVLLYLALRGVEWKRVGTIVAQCRIEYLLLACGCATLSYIVRAMRWRVLLDAQEKLKATTVLWASSVGYLANNYLPARTGELIRTAMISSRSRLSRTYVFTTAMTERVIELVILVLMAFLMSMSLAHRPEWLTKLMIACTSCTLAGTAILVALPAFDRAGTGLIARLPVGKQLRERLHGIAANTTLALSAVRDPRRLLRLCVLTALVWTLDATAAIILAHALGMRLLFPVALLLATGLALGNALPSTPGAIGIFQFAAVTVLVPFNFTRTDAIAYILVAQAAAYFVITTLGLIALWHYRADAKTEIPQA